MRELQAEVTTAQQQVAELAAMVQESFDGSAEEWDASPKNAPTGGITGLVASVRDAIRHRQATVDELR